MAVIRKLIGKVAGPQGEIGPQGPQGNIGETGQRGTRWLTGTAIDGIFTTDTVCSATDIADSLVNDHYLNPSTGNIYRCTVPGDADTAKWVWVGQLETSGVSTDDTLSIKGAAADAEAVGEAINAVNSTISSIKTGTEFVVGSDDPEKVCLWFDTSSSN